MTNTRSTWSHEMRVLICSTLRMTFGKSENGKLPGETVLVLACYARLARYFSEVTGQKISLGAVQQQARWAIHQPEDVASLAPGHWRNFVCNKAAALEAGLIGQSDIFPAKERS